MQRQFNRARPSKWRPKKRKDIPAFFAFLTRGPAGPGASRPKGQTCVKLDQYPDMDLAYRARPSIWRPNKRKDIPAFFAFLTRGPAGPGASRPKGQTCIKLDLHLDLNKDLNVDLVFQSSRVRSKRGTFYNRTNRASIYNFWIIQQKQ